MQELLQGCPDWLCKYFEYCKSLEYTQKPDYNYLKGLMNDDLKARKFVLAEDRWDWDIQRENIIRNKIQQEEYEKAAKLAAINKKNTKGKEK
jgi:predicted  nucleic acid-binding Zn-ribbon protein